MALLIWDWFTAFPVIAFSAIFVNIFKMKPLERSGDLGSTRRQGAIGLRAHYVVQQHSLVLLTAFRSFSHSTSSMRLEGSRPVNTDYRLVWSLTPLPSDNYSNCVDSQARAGHDLSTALHTYFEYSSNKPAYKGGTHWCLDQPGPSFFALTTTAKS